ncbi:MAG: hypothetical protein M1820_003210 [Bogoriella megaspora]|nr:MAG: hypothetical protein M1820_003210 [Bogoriella megaspora]
MTTSAAQDEFDALFSTKDRPAAHPEDRAENSDSDDSTSHGRTNTRKNTYSSTAAWKLNQSRRDPDLSSDEDYHDTTEKHDRTNVRLRNNAMATTTATYTLPPLYSEANTGPKGVIADAQSYETAKKSHYKRFSLFRNGASKSLSPPAPTIRSRSADGNRLGNNNEKSARSSSSDASEADDEVRDEEGFLARWRQSRLRQLQDRNSNNRNTQAARTERSKSRSKRVWGSLVTVDSLGYLDAIDRVMSDTVVVVLIADDGSEVSRMVEECVRMLAAVHGTTRFVKLGYEDAEMEEAGVPAILAYKGGEKFAGLVPVLDEIPEEEELDVRTLELAMRR